LNEKFKSYDNNNETQDFEQMEKIIIEIPLKTVSEFNSSEHWRLKAKRHRMQKFFVREALKPYLSKITLPCVIKCIRIGSRFLDEHDNLRGAFKFIIDQAADCLIPGKQSGQADNDIRIKWEYGQEKSKKYGVRIEISGLSDHPHLSTSV